MPRRSPFALLASLALAGAAIAAAAAEPSYYDVLGIAKDASAADIKKGYRKQAGVTPPRHSSCKLTQLWCGHAPTCGDVGSVVKALVEGRSATLALASPPRVKPSLVYFVSLRQRGARPR